MWWIFGKRCYVDRDSWSAWGLFTLCMHFCHCIAFSYSIAFVGQIMACKNSSVALYSRTHSH
jgi:hypothetical protein